MGKRFVPSVRIQRRISDGTPGSDDGDFIDHSDPTFPNPTSTSAAAAMAPAPPPAVVTARGGAAPPSFYDDDD
uniref:Uncharacterized protein n=1 Tax=Oryza sativa subsp. japonica TaxID=39947 RepID=Q69LE8_ORYSJ|nr:hypothetical protein [Oryza sativa Japonica Group]